MKKFTDDLSDDDIACLSGFCQVMAKILRPFPGMEKAMDVFLFDLFLTGFFRGKGKFAESGQLHRELMESINRFFDDFARKAKETGRKPIKRPIWTN